ncbi:hypothetical protein [Streptomyces cinnamoneus]|uniref:hypothetical protein n=1 Tax=Streptomyces cinnamoneus TaxID=53446 RepID=UPI001EFEE6A4|nr:hypothetical protein [Streptomyces cinnamoneus]
MKTTPLSPVETERPVPRWAMVTARAIPLVLLPQCLWRLPFAFHFQMGMAHDPDAAVWPVWATIPYVFGLSLLTEALALLCFGLVRGWGEVAPAWLPFIGGKRIPPAAALVPATLGGLGATAFWAPSVLVWLGLIEDDSVGYVNGGWETLARVCIAPGTLWGPMVLALTYGYYVRRCRPGKRAG